MKIVAIFILGIALVIPTSWHLTSTRDSATSDDRLQYKPSYELLHFTSLDHQLILSELLFYEASFYFGSVNARKKQKPDYLMLFNYLDTATRLNPYNIDAYYLGQAVLTWDGRMVSEMNEILERGATVRTWDFYLPFFLGFNHSYFYNNHEKAAEYIAIAARRNPRAGYLTTLASRHYYEANRTGQAIEYLKVVLEGTQNEMLRRSLVTRLEALESIAFLERAVKEFTRKTGKQPQELTDLVQSKFLKAIPPDPYGGVFYIDPADGRIKTTSKMSFSGARK